MAGASPGYQDPAIAEGRTGPAFIRDAFSRPASAVPRTEARAHEVLVAGEQVEVDVRRRSVVGRPVNPRLLREHVLEPRRDVDVAAPVERIRERLLHPRPDHRRIPGD